MNALTALHCFLVEHPIGTGIIGTVTSFLTSATALLQFGTLLFGFVSALAGAVAGVYTVLLLIRKYRAGKLTAGGQA